MNFFFISSKRCAKVQKSQKQIQYMLLFPIFATSLINSHFMKRLFCGIFVFSFLCLTVSAQYGPQLDNRGFEQWTTREVTSVSEPVHWHSGGTATGTWSGFLSSQIEQSSQTRPGSSGGKSVRLFPDSVLGVTANGTMTNGRMNAGSMSATGSGNYNYTQRSESAFNTPINQLPDSLTVWVCFRSQSSTDKAQVKAVVHGNADYKLIANGTEEPADMHVATAVSSFTRTSTANGAYTWRRLSIPFNNSGPCTDVRYILLTATTNETPGTGSTNDDLFVDDVLLVYNPTLRMEQLASNEFTINSTISIPFTLSGTMSPENLNATPNVVIAQLSDANGNFSNPIELGRVTTNTSGSITAQIPTVSAGQHYKIRVVSTNYPMIGGNIQEISIINTSAIEDHVASCQIYPNPFNSTLSIMTEKTVKNILIYDVFGRLVKRQPASETQIDLDLSGLSWGVYMLRLDYGDSISTHRIVKAAR